MLEIKKIAVNENVLQNSSTVVLTADLDGERIIWEKDGATTEATVVHEYGQALALERDPEKREEYLNKILAIIRPSVNLNDEIEAINKFIDGELEIKDDTQLFFDGQEVDKALGQHIISMARDRALGNYCPDDAWIGIANFIDKLYKNFRKDVRDQLWRWLSYQQQHGGFKITRDGNVIGYKSLDDNPRYNPEKAGNEDPYNKKWASVFAGHAFVNGEEFGAERPENIPQETGDVVTMSRHEVTQDPAIGCSAGLHVGTFNYASNQFRHAVVIEVEFNPKDVVSVPTECDAQKVRVCKYTVLNPIIPDSYYNHLHREIDLDALRNLDQRLIVDVTINSRIDDDEDDYDYDDDDDYDRDEDDDDEDYDYDEDDDVDDYDTDDDDDDEDDDDDASEYSRPSYSETKLNNNQREIPWYLK